MASIASGRLEKFSIGRVFSNTFLVIGRSFGSLAMIVGLFTALPALIYNSWNFSRIASLRADGVAGMEQAALANYGITSMIAALVIFVLAFLAQAALVRATVEDLNGKRPAVGDCIQVALRSFLPAFGIGVVVFLAMMVAGFATVIIAWLIPIIGWLVGLAIIVAVAIWVLSISVAVPVVVQEREGVFGSISRSRQLTKGSRWAIFGLFLIIGLIAMVFQGGFSLLFGLVIADPGGISSTGVAVGAIGSSLVSSIFSTVISVAIAVTYVELRRVKEGTSVDELAEIFS
ncbi:hypothetical protein LB565_05035 [Mesorhizobium sp. CA14]|uniref:hypothetical protein n=1 Tax=Mesorhizobium sp. CA14 TaxID=2876642 RepID=UPI001CCA7200|nr:hypothetical protein [Mesorhizobium sp. CA14]MBZ9847356.1 hypothetical protein [Mesorhizobium sp. CA14]